MGDDANISFRSNLHKALWRMLSRWGETFGSFSNQLYTWRAFCMIRSKTEKTPDTWRNDNNKRRRSKSPKPRLELEIIVQFGWIFFSLPLSLSAAEQPFWMEIMIEQDKKRTTTMIHATKLSSMAISLFLASSLSLWYLLSYGTSAGVLSLRSLKALTNPSHSDLKLQSWIATYASDTYAWQIFFSRERERENFLKCFATCPSHLPPPPLLVDTVSVAEWDRIWKWAVIECP